MTLHGAPVSVILAIALLAPASSLALHGAGSTTSRMGAVPALFPSARITTTHGCPGTTATGGPPGEQISLEFDACTYRASLSVTSYVAVGKSSNGTSVIGSTPLSAYNITIYLGGIAEVTPAGDVVRFANLSAPSSFHSELDAVSNSSVFYFNGTNAVTNASGAWSLGSLSNKSIVQVASVVGMTGIDVAFNVSRGLSSASSVKFTVDAINWPWYGSQDSLGMELVVLGHSGANLSWDQASMTVSDTSAVSGEPLGSVVLGTNAFATGPTGTRLLSVNTQAEASNETQMDLLAGFQGAGGYARLHYDPWVRFALRSPSTSMILGTVGWVAITVGLTAAVFLTIAAVWVRRQNRPVALAGSCSAAYSTALEVSQFRAS